MDAKESKAMQISRAIVLLVFCLLYESSKVVRLLYIVRKVEGREGRKEF